VEIVVVGSIRAKSGRAGELETELQALVAPTHDEDGCLLYAFHRGVDDPDRFAFIERWASPEALAAHRGSSHIAKYQAQAADLLATPSDIVVYEAVALGDPRKGALASAGRES
jgi:quinol monooxygenase YgiN